jgi:outer membrane cobalamin receptor
MYLRKAACLLLIIASTSSWADTSEPALETIIVTANRTADSGATLGQAWSALSPKRLRLWTCSTVISCLTEFRVRG